MLPTLNRQAALLDGTALENIGCEGRTFAERERGQVKVLTVDGRRLCSQPMRRGRLCGRPVGHTGKHRSVESVDQRRAYWCQDYQDHREETLAYSRANQQRANLLREIRKAERKLGMRA